MKYQIGYFVETANGRKFDALKTLKRATDAEVEAEVDSLFSATPLDPDGYVRRGLYIKRGGVKWFTRFSAHLIASHPKRLVGSDH